MNSVIGLLQIVGILSVFLYIRNKDVFEVLRHLNVYNNGNRVQKSNMSFSHSLTTSNDEVEGKRLKLEIHPLLIDLIARKIFQYLPLNDILECRAVCKLWHCEGTKRLVARINGVTINPPMTKTYGASVVNSFLNMNENCAFRFTNFAFYAFPIGSSETIKLFALCGSAIKSLHLSQVSVTSAQFSDLLSNLPLLESMEISNLPKEVISNSIFSDEKPTAMELKKLTLHLEYQTIVYGRNFLSDLFKSCKKLTSLAIISNYDSAYREHMIIETLIAEGGTQQIRELRLSSVDDRVLRLLEAHFKQSKLEKFSIGYKAFLDLQENVLQTFIDDHVNSWNHIQFGIHSFIDVFKFQQMKNLKFLSIGTNYPMTFHDDNLSFDAYNYGTQFPNLVTLKLFYAGSRFGKKRIFNLDELFPGTSTAATSVKNLELPPGLSCEVLRRIGKIFPNVLKLNLRSQPYDVLSELWTTWPLIKTLAISVFGYEENCTNLDSIFTGVSEEFLEQWEKSEGELDIESFRTKPSICLLKHLRHLIIYDGPCLGQWQSSGLRSQITDATAVLSFSKMKELVCLNVSKSLHQITDDCVQDLCLQLDLLEVECSITMQLVKYEWQGRLSTINSYLFESFPEYL